MRAQSETSRTMRCAWMASVWMVWMCGCGSAANPEPAASTWELSEPPSSIDLSSDDTQRLFFPSGTFSWQPPNTDIVVHTALEAEQHRTANYAHYRHVKDDYLGLLVNLQFDANIRDEMSPYLS